MAEAEKINGSTSLTMILSKERQIRPNVLLRKIVFGNRSEKGILNHNCLMSILQTAHLKKLDAAALSAIPP